METVGAVVACIVLGALAAFQAGLALGAPWGRLAWGGQHERLPSRLRAASASSIALYGVFAAVLLDRAGLADLVPAGVSGVGSWVLAGYFLLGIVLNGISRSRPERLTMTPVCALLCASCVAVALG